MTGLLWFLLWLVIPLLMMGAFLLFALSPLIVAAYLIWRRFKRAKEPRVCRECGTIFRGDGMRSRRQDLCPKCRSRRRLVTQTPKRLGLRLAAWLLMLVALLTFMLNNGGIPLWRAVLWSVVSIAVLMLVLIALAIKRLGALSFWRALRLLLRFSLRLLPRVDLWEARRSAKGQGRLVKGGPLMVWTDSPAQNVPSRLTETARRTGDAFGHLTGLTEPVEKPCRVLCFEGEDALRRYHGSLNARIGRHAGTYARVAGRIVMCREVCDYVPHGLESAMAHEFTHHILSTRRGALGAAWWQEGLATLMAAQVAPTPHAPGAALRWLRAAAARGALWEPEAFVVTNYEQLREKTRHWQDAGASFAASVFYTQSAALVRRLTREKPEGFRDFAERIKSLRRYEDLEAAFRDCFGRSMEEAAEASRQDVLATPVPPPGPVPHELRERFGNKWAPAALDRHTDEDDRRLAVRTIGSLGYPQWLDVVQQVAERPDDPLREDAAIARDILMAREASRDEEAPQTPLSGTIDS